MIRLEDIVIDPEFRDLLPSLEDRSKLALKIESEGWTDEPITVWQHHNILLDGHNRYAIWQEQLDRGDDVDGPPIRELKLASREAAYYWIVSNQLARRNLTDEQRRYLIGRSYTAEKKCPGGDRGNQYTKVASPQNEDLPDSDKPKTNKTAHRIGKEHGVSRAQVERSERYANAVDKLDKDGVVKKEDILSGKVKLPATKVVAAAKAETSEEAKAVLETKTRKTKEEAPTSTATNTDAPRERDDKAFVAQVDAINFLQRSKLVRLAKNNPDRLWAFDEVILWLKQQKANNG